MEYKAYPIGHDGHRQPAAIILSETDERAIDQVKRMLNGLPIELWQGTRMVGWFQNTSSGLAIVTPLSEAMPPAPKSSPESSTGTA